MRCWILAMAMVFAGPVYADTLTRSLAKSGDWAAVAHAPSQTARPDVCLAIDATVGTALRTDPAGIALQVQNPHWDLPAMVRWPVKVMIGSDTRSFPVTSNTSNIVSATMTPAALAMLLDEMAGGSTMRIVVGATTPLTASLAGSTVVLNAFRNCAGIGNGEHTPTAAPG